jgi:hypothetical protein
MRGMGGANQN